MNYAILKKAMISEKSFQMAAEGKFCFIVDKSADKNTVADAVAELFSVDVLDVNMSNYIGKEKRTKKGAGKRSNYKKAIVTVKKGQKIDLFEVEKDKKNENAVADKKSKSVEEKSSLNTTVRVREKKSNYQKRVSGE